MTEMKKYADEKEKKDDDIFEKENEEMEEYDEDVEKMTITTLASKGSLLKHILIITTAVLLTLQLSSWYSTATSTPYSKPTKIVSTKNVIKNCGLRLSGDLQQAILEKHNEIRSKVAMGEYPLGFGKYLPSASRMSKLTWDCDLESEAQDRASICDLSKEQQQNEKDQGNLRGENAFYFQTEDDNVKAAVLKGISKMGEEIEEFGIDAVSDAKYEKNIGHATQIIWESTQKVGCAIQECTKPGRRIFDASESFKVAVCKYYPTGNIFNSQKRTSIYTEGVPGAQCVDDGSFDPTTGLCVHKDSNISKK